jgi:hypothetical protein
MLRKLLLDKVNMVLPVVALVAVAFLTGCGSNEAVAGGGTGARTAGASGGKLKSAVKGVSKVTKGAMLVSGAAHTSIGSVAGDKEAQASGVQKLQATTQQKRGLVNPSTGKPINIPNPKGAKK